MRMRASFSLCTGNRRSLFSKHCWRVAGTTCSSTTLKPLSNKRREQLRPSIAASSRHITRDSKRPFLYRKLQQHYPRPTLYAVTRPTSKEKMDSVRNKRIFKTTPTGFQYNMISCTMQSSLSQPQSYRKHTGHEGSIYYFSSKQFSSSTVFSSAVIWCYTQLPLFSWS